MAVRGPIGLPARPERAEGLYSSEPVLGVPRTAPREPVGRHLLLFAATFATAALANALAQGVDLGAQPLGIVAGVPYATTLMAILLAHEFGHYLTARTHAVDATLPFFIPAPPNFLFGTFGAFIRMRSQPPNRRVLFDIGAAGPWAGLAVAVPAVIVGLALSEVERTEASNLGGLILGDSLLFRGLSWLVLGLTGDDATIILHPIALAGWAGLFVTAINLMPVGQLDGGHVVYAALGERWHRLISIGTVVGLLALGLTGASSWLIWAALLALLGLRHPQLSETAVGLDRPRRWGAAATLLLFILTFMPEPLWFAGPAPPAPRFPEAIPVVAPAPPSAGDGVWL
jgi:Zn-dependent protease